MFECAASAGHTLCDLQHIFNNTNRFQCNSMRLGTDLYAIEESLFGFNYDSVQHASDNAEIIYSNSQQYYKTDSALYRNNEKLYQEFQTLVPCIDFSQESFQQTEPYGLLEASLTPMLSHKHTDQAKLSLEFETLSGFPVVKYYVDVDDVDLTEPIEEMDDGANDEDFEDGGSADGWENGEDDDNDDDENENEPIAELDDDYDDDDDEDDDDVNDTDSVEYKEAFKLYNAEAASLLSFSDSDIYASEDSDTAEVEVVAGVTDDVVTRCDAANASIDMVNESPKHSRVKKRKRHRDSYADYYFDESSDDHERSYKADNYECDFTEEISELSDDNCKYSHLVNYIMEADAGEAREKSKQNNASEINERNNIEAEYSVECHKDMANALKQLNAAYTPSKAEKRAAENNDEVQQNEVKKQCLSKTDDETQLNKTEENKNKCAEYKHKCEGNMNIYVLNIIEESKANEYKKTNENQLITNEHTTNEYENENANTTDEHKSICNDYKNNIEENVNKHNEYKRKTDEKNNNKSKKNTNLAEQNKHISDEYKNIIEEINNNKTDELTNITEENKHKSDDYKGDDCKNITEENKLICGNTKSMENEHKSELNRPNTTEYMEDHHKHEVKSDEYEQKCDEYKNEVDECKQTTEENRIFDSNISVDIMNQCDEHEWESSCDEQREEKKRARETKKYDMENVNVTKR